MTHPIGSIGQQLSARAQQLYCNVLEGLREARIPYVVGGSYAAAQYTGRTPHTKDLDIFLPPGHLEPALDALARRGLHIERPYPYWIAKASDGEEFADLIYRAASGLWEVDAEWHDRAGEAKLWGRTVPICPIEELIWTKAALMDRDRYDGNDVLHLLQAKAHELDWEHLRELAGNDWRLLLSHLTLFGYVYPDLIPLVPRHLLAELSLRLLSERYDNGDSDEPLCRGTLISNTQYIEDVERLGYRDARLKPAGALRPDQLRPWNEAVKRGET